MNPKINPFTLNPIEDIELLTGRDKFLKMVKDDYIFNMESFVLIGGSRTGKTSFLKSLCNENFSDIDFLYWDVSSTDEGNSWEYFTEILRIRFSNEINGSINSPDDFFKLYNEKKGSECKLVIILDEFEILLEKKTFSPLIFRKFRSYLTKYGNSFLTFILSSPLKIENLRIPEEEGSGFFNMLHEVYLPLIETEPDDFYSSYLQKFDNIYKTKTSDKFNAIINAKSFDKDKLFQWVGRHPYLLQLIGFDLYKESENVQLLLLIRKNQEKFDTLFIRWLQKGYFDEFIIANLYIANILDEKISNKINYLISWAFIDEENKLNGDAINLALSSALLNLHKTYVDKSNTDNKYRDNLLLSIEKSFKDGEDLNSMTITKPFFIDLFIIGWLSIDDKKIVKNLNL